MKRLAPLVVMVVDVERIGEIDPATAGSAHKVLFIIPWFWSPFLHRDFFS